MLPVLQQGFPTSINEFTTQYGDLLVSFGITVLSFVVTFLILYLVGKPILVRMTKRALNAREFSPSIVSVGSSIAGTIAVFGAVAIAAVVAGFPVILSAFATIFAALALGFAFAASDIVENFIAGIFIIKDKPFEVGDYIEWDGNGGVVREINLRVSKLDTWDNEQVTVPNGDLANGTVTNPMANETRRVTFDFGIEYDASIKDARSIILEEAAKIDGVLDDPEPAAPVTGLADSAVVLNGRVWINPQETGAGGVKHQLVENVKRRFDAEGIGMPYPYTELTGSIEVEQIGHDGAVADD
ncbi:mechanosensitive ion channel family protein [Halapricum hydrolyticum]|uniref:Mechanosensitive ion channel family protein n=1 Tax=Halapricum hydrolyticum TaxID=2979991 RepID=A0AAE3LGF9_9EURY|nr:mechanosensitive ion channel family protein [Halapricum hydrolyticum]MCU4719710.1 mechanosensitive ion channel family protein [Halapricum hydrolyticum]MCU4728627.1 mechanosensitive ion channel family protein [Halapricum hydrolyticum]